LISDLPGGGALSDLFDSRDDRSESIINGTLTFLTSISRKRVTVGHLVAIRILQAYVEDVRAAAHLHAPYFGSFLDLAVCDQPPWG